MSDRSNFGSDALIVGGAALAGYVYYRMGQYQRAKVKRAIGIVSTAFWSVAAWVAVSSVLSEGTSGHPALVPWAITSIVLAVLGAFMWYRQNRRIRLTKAFVHFYKRNPQLVRRDFPEYADQIYREWGIYG